MSVEQFVGLVYIIHVGTDAVLCSAHVVEGVVADGVTLRFDLIKQLRVFPYVVAYKEEGSLDTSLTKGVKKEWR